MDVDTQSGNKCTHAMEEEDDPATAAQERTNKTLQKIKEKKKAETMSQPKISFVTATDRIPRAPPTKCRDKATARKLAVARTQTMINHKEEYIQCEANSTPALAPKQAARNGIGTLMEKLDGIIILSLEGDARIIRNKGTLPKDWKNGLNRYATIKGGNAAMKHVHGGGVSSKSSPSRSRSAATRTWM